MRTLIFCMTSAWYRKWLDSRALRAVSRFLKTPCFPAGAGPDYVNAVISVSYEGSPSELIALLHVVEAEFMRVRDQRWGMRTLDLDLLDEQARSVLGLIRADEIVIR